MFIMSSDELKMIREEERKKILSILDEMEKEVKTRYVPYIGPVETEPLWSPSTIWEIKKRISENLIS